MKSFLKYTVASCLGVFLAILLFGLIGTLLVGGLIAGLSKAGPKASIKPNSVLQLTLDKQIPEHTNNVPFQFEDFDFKYPEVLGLSDIVTTIEHASGDPDIKGIYLNVQSTPNGLSTSKVLREAIDSFSRSGKFVVSYSNNYSQLGYYLSSGSDRIFMNPNGMVDFRGFGAIIPYFKETFDRLGIDMQVYYAGDYKSATEPFRRTDMSEENREQTREFLLDLERNIYRSISEDRNISLDSLYSVSDQFLLRFASDAVRYGFVDQLAYEDEVFDHLRDQIGLGSDEKINFVKLKKYYHTFNENLNYSADQKIAVVCAEGSITSESEEPGEISEKKYLDIFDKIQRDEKVKVVVLRINSPGGSALVSDNIWRELQILKSKGIRIIISMGDYAASGGYYIAAPGDFIFSEPTTITGSIGVFNIMPNMNELFTEKMGLHFDSLHTGRYATKFNIIYPNSEKENEIMQTYVDSIYMQFLRRVAEGRDMTIDEVREVAGGRVWSGSDALSIGLVDSMGGLNEAIQYAAQTTDLEDYRIDEYPKIKDPFEQFLSEFTGENISENIRTLYWQQSIPETYRDQLEELKHMLKTDEPMARLPFILMTGEK